jgi:hypothetical protein
MAAIGLGPTTLLTIVSVMTCAFALLLAASFAATGEKAHHKSRRQELDRSPRQSPPRRGIAA